ncbi:hypothetical protein F7D95_07880 [Prevotella copri]|uniref:Glycosyl-hydrolase 97 N-terminal domain-containing protein n=2 Tax=Segatella copri TaxID=165179 RepID=A0AA90ZLK5_9BACT|nr:hypothetical protein [Segatella copri]
MSIAGILLLAALGMQANSYTVKSPDGKLVVNVACEGGKASYTVDYNGKQMLRTSALGLVANYGDFSKNLTMGILKGGEVKPLAYKMTRIKKSDIQKDVVDATIGFLNSKKDSMTLHLHVSNNDIAYKYEMSRPKKDNPKSVIIYNEVSGFNFPEYNPQNEMFSHFGMKRYNFKNETQLFKVIPHTSKIQKNRPASPERNTFEGS